MRIFAMNIPVNYSEEKRELLYIQIMTAFDEALALQEFSKDEYSEDEDEPRILH